MLAPDMQVYAPWRDQQFLDAFGGREEMLAYCTANNVPIKPPKISKYSTDANLLGLTHEAGELESLDTRADFVDPGMGVRKTDAPDKPEQVTIAFEKGFAISINGVTVASAAEAMTKANEIAGRNAVGINTHLLENRFVGTKSRGIYEAPGMELLGKTYAYILEAVLDRRSRRLFDFCSSYYAEQLYDGFSEALGSQLVKHVFTDVAKFVTGTVTVELYKGSISFVSATDIPHSLYVEANASMSAVEGYDHKDSEGFLRVLGLGARAAAQQGQIPRID
jgi:argininosuccinate synthase